MLLLTAGVPLRPAPDPEALANVRALVPTTCTTTVRHRPAAIYPHVLSSTAGLSGWAPAPSEEPAEPHIARRTGATLNYEISREGVPLLVLGSSGCLMLWGELILGCASSIG